MTTGDGKQTAAATVAVARIVFGGAVLPADEALSLSPGDVIELDNNMSDDVELCCDGRRIARGRAAVLGGKVAMKVGRRLAPAVCEGSNKQ